ncbi:MAG TPA: hemerythrin domain-containing protein [Thermoanaerobaculia bacterium]|nr:hemerythrin domain-containing protein [Thermoanaerobaculia bacterium]
MPHGPGPETPGLPPANDPSTEAGSAAGREANDRIEQEHVVLRRLVERLEEANELSRLTALLEELRPLLQDHFRHEEASDGLHAAVAVVAPQRLGSLERLFAEHRQFLRTVDRLLGQAHQLLDGPIAELLRGASQLAWELRCHEESETDLFGETMTTDLGSGD